MATFLFISFAVAVGVFVTNLGRAQVEEGAVCPVEIHLQEKSICYQGQQLVYSVQNGINTEIIGLIISIVGTEEAQTSEVDVNLAKAGIHSGKIDYDAAKSGKIRQIKISPKINLYDEEHICVEQGIIRENVEDC